MGSELFGKRVDPGCQQFFVYWPSCAAAPISVVDGVWGGGPTSKISRIKHRPPKRDSSELKTSAESLTPPRCNSAEADRVNSQSGLFSSTAG